MVAARAGQAGFVAQRRRPAGRRPRPRPRAAPPRRRHLLRGRGPLPGAARAPARLRRQALPPLRRTLRLRAGLRRPPRPLPLPELRRRPAAPGRRRDRDRAATGCAGSRVTLRTPEGELELRAPPPRPLQRLQRARRARPPRCASASRSSAVAGRCERCEARVRARRDDRGRRQAGLDPAGQEPRRRQRGAAHPAPRGHASDGAARPLDRAQRPDRRRPRRLLGLGRRLRAARRQRAPRGLRGHARRRRWRCA